MKLPFSFFPLSPLFFLSIPDITCILSFLLPLLLELRSMRINLYEPLIMAMFPMPRAYYKSLVSTYWMNKSMRAGRELVNKLNKPSTGLGTLYRLSPAWWMSSWCYRWRNWGKTCPRWWSYNKWQSLFSKLGLSGFLYTIMLPCRKHCHNDLKRWLQGWGCCLAASLSYSVQSLG